MSMPQRANKGTFVWTAALDDKLLALVAAKYRSHEIARMLGCSARTVQNRRGKIGEADRQANRPPPPDKWPKQHRFDTHGRNLKINRSPFPLIFAGVMTP